MPEDDRIEKAPSWGLFHVWRVLWQRPLLAAWFVVPIAIAMIVFVIGAKNRRPA
jgi:hypothetical protein